MDVNNLVLQNEVVAFESIGTGTCHHDIIHPAGCACAGQDINADANQVTCSLGSLISTLILHLLAHQVAILYFAVRAICF